MRYLTRTYFYKHANMIDPDVLEIALNNSYSNFFRLSFVVDDTPFSFIVNPYEYEEVFLRYESLEDALITEFPIYMGYRSELAETLESEYITNIYDKSCWVMHMLRNLMTDWRTMDDSRFINMLKELYASWNGKEINTADYHTTSDVFLSLEVFL